MCARARARNLGKNCSWLDTLLKITWQEFAATMSVEITQAFHCCLMKKKKPKRRDSLTKDYTILGEF